MQHHADCSAGAAVLAGPPLSASAALSTACPGLAGGVARPHFCHLPAVTQAERVCRAALYTGRAKTPAVYAMMCAAVASITSLFTFAW